MSFSCFGVFESCKKDTQKQVQEISTNNVRVFSFNSLRSATGDFHPSNRIGGGGFGVVYRTWKLREEGRLLDIVDPELSQYPENEVARFIKVALFCTQAGTNQRPTMKQVVEMLSKEVNLNEKLLTRPGVFKLQNSRPFGGSSSEETSSSQKKKGKQSAYS
ncbi:hypothetical protein Pint_35190 [Pistacia integerrima]|uniref:Uncharacterized protein n=1 Tax=Pistacia integerrima TaxID=434235 RepID=A0ACC0Y2A6_9ROSI|nr:hypothetical protein Pint_35190 [Pistacia integerrima]